MEIELGYFLPTQIVYVTKLRPPMRIKIFTLTKTNSILATIQKIARFSTKNKNKKVIGKFKDEACGTPIKEFVGLRSKMYSSVKDNEKEAKTAKGIKQVVINKVIKHEDYKNTLFNNKQIYHQMKTIRSVNHQLGSYDLIKISLSCFDDIRYIHNNGKSSFAYHSAFKTYLSGHLAW